MTDNHYEAIIIGSGPGRTFRAAKPKSQASVRGLYLASAETSSKGMGTHQSALSRMMVADMAEGYRSERLGVMK